MFRFLFPQPDSLPTLTGLPCDAFVQQLENESFDQLFPDIPGTENLVDWMAGKSRMGIPYFEQEDHTGTVMTSLPPPMCSGVPCGAFPASVPNKPYLASLYWPENATSSFDSTHRYYQEQFQINGGAMNRYAAWGGSTTANADGVLIPAATAWTLQYWDVSHQYLGALAQNYTVYDRDEYIDNICSGRYLIRLSFIPFCILLTSFLSVAVKELDLCQLSLWHSAQCRP